ncbi:hypothetical protein BT63DRAFT_369506 [Microthyrium microscopicum]|uniref:Uncharacterized protein n=1 Tax=Microthyrium microscopicum TaxID=703497 RepID=A0A6A6UKM1_9PEZI|nr:hypothetical protein BT63DRAFT_369506 [Microthyrium microscopicum]
MDPAKVQIEHPKRPDHSHSEKHEPHHHTHEFLSKIRKIIRSNGKIAHVAGSPADVEPLKRRISTILPNEDEWDIVIHGSEDHLEALRDAHNHHEILRNGLRVKHGHDFDEFERIIKELDKLQHELHQISEHAVKLDANFSKYGYSANLRSLPAESGTNSSSASTLGAHDDHEHRDWESERNQGDHMVFFQTPVIRQYFHKGFLWRASDATEIASYELFVDLLYVGILAITGDSASENPTGESLLRFAITFTMAWKVWGDLSQAISWISMDDIIRRLSVMFFMVLLLGMTVNMGGFYEGTYTPLVAFYIAARWFCGFYFLWMAYLMPIVRESFIGSAIISFFPAFFWIGSIHVEEPNRQALIWVALFFDIMGPALLVAIERAPNWLGSAKPWAERIFQFIPGNNIEHKIERTNAFVSLVFGYSVVALLYQSAVPIGINAYFVKAVLGLIQAFTFNWLYFEIDNFNMHSHAIRRHFFSAFLWISAHMPFTMAFSLAGAALSKIVLAHDTADADPENLMDPYKTKSEAEVEVGLYWFYCAGLGVALISTGMISLSHRTKVIPGARMTKNARLSYRLLAGVAIILLPLAHERMNSLEFVAVTTCIVFSVLLLELAGTTCSGAEFWGFREKRFCTYSANCKISKRELAEKAKTGEVLDLEKLAMKGKKENQDDLVL